MLAVIGRQPRQAFREQAGHLHHTRRLIMPQPLTPRSTGNHLACPSISAPTNQEVAVAHGRECLNCKAHAGGHAAGHMLICLYLIPA